MVYTPKILAFAGSLRTDSYNKKLVKIAADGARAAGAEVTYVDFRDLPMPLYDEDLEAKEGIPPNAREFKNLMLSHQGLLIASPEYNSSLSAVLKNAIDWASRSDPGEPMLAAFTDKIAAIMSASPGGLGGLRGLIYLRSLLGNIRVMVVPDQVAISNAHEAFHENGSLRDAAKYDSVLSLGKKVATMLHKLS
ncbi:NAD(P)H-dependent oxidoreductase [Oculatella sp. LEGE 06141]|uniref:NADPH-dependent FMN reductase n=1 Tax=Oculatella sp. LEGE 06141 TaxID=1828648 RepID=UPI001882F4BB|nr:NAD(P)H-dependent oxidoreductase [Oculatella sp. LEGE 06141]MBE9178065.1 NAD(P)H-dependent oxidoreductase [Oculatella sp. LEGE 06141]